MDMSVLFITHNLGVVAQIADQRGDVCRTHRRAG
jgi:ABC-type dipeptide/oligopeptide/nickel transport system ATPase component